MLHGMNGWPELLRKIGDFLKSWLYFLDVFPKACFSGKMSDEGRHLRGEGLVKGW